MQCRDGDLLLVIRGLNARYTDEIIFCQRLCFSLCCIVLSFPLTYILIRFFDNLLLE